MSVRLGRIDAFQGLRAVAFLAILLSHLPLGNFECLGAWGVSVFFILSGFLMMLSNLNKKDQPMFGFRFAWNKIRSLYLLHIIMMLLCAVYVMNEGEGIVNTIRNMGIHTLLLQMWIPKSTYYATLNGPSWYLCASFFLYLCFPLIFKFCRKYLDQKRTYIALGLSVVAQITVCVVAYFFTPVDNAEWFNTQWLVYYFPPVRLIDYLIGCLLGYLFATKTKSDSGGKSVPRTVAVFGEVLLCVVIVGSWVIYTNRYGILGAKPVRYSLLFMPGSACLIWCIASKAGVLHKILSVKPLVLLGNLSPYTFLIHGVAIHYCFLFFAMIHRGNMIIISVAATVLTIVAAIIWRKLWNDVKRG